MPMADAAEPLERYARRIGVRGPLQPDQATLRTLHRAHLETIPFENSSVLFGEPIEIGQAAFVRKLADGRGGFCYELNGAFGALLEATGFAVDYLEARVYDEGRLEGPRFDHLALRVTLDEPWLVDVGFGHFFLEPLRLQHGLEQRDPMGEFRLSEADDGTDVEWRHRDGNWQPHYRIDLLAHELGDFGPTCAYQQTSPKSPFLGGWVCSRIEGTGGITLLGRRLVDTSSGVRVDREVDQEEIPELLRTHFGILAERDGDRWRPSADAQPG